VRPTSLPCISLDYASGPAIWLLLLDGVYVQGAGFRF
jgi:hypothetical protein